MLLTLVLVGACPFGGKFPVPDAVKEAVKHRGVAISREVRQQKQCGDNPSDNLIHFGKFPMSDEQLEAACAGIDDLHAAAREDGFKETAVKPYWFYEIYTPPYVCIPSPEQRIPSFLVNGGTGYDGSEWDQHNSKGPLAPQDVHIDQRGLKQIYKKDERSAVFAAEMILSIGTPGSTYQTGWMVVCPDLSVVRNAVRHGGDHIFLANFPYTEEWRNVEPYDEYVWFWASLIHGPPHPLIPRGGRLAESASRQASEKPAASIISETPIEGDVKKRAESLGIAVGVSDAFVESSNAVILPVK